MSGSPRDSSYGRIFAIWPGAVCLILFLAFILAYAVAVTANERSVGSEIRVYRQLDDYAYDDLAYNDCDNQGDDDCDDEGEDSDSAEEDCKGDEVCLLLLFLWLGHACFVSGISSKGIPSSQVSEKPKPSSSTPAFLTASPPVKSTPSTPSTPVLSSSQDSRRHYNSPQQYIHVLCSQIPEDHQKHHHPRLPPLQR
ncbi:hypothetical protein CPB85DRAFT_1312012 [Mucidula mucida]|nr:hypothetical protein CPB85DRAFT_1312012 [Mucidula mucida]